jgi:hypothetical protein
MPATEQNRTPETVARLGIEVFERCVKPLLRPKDEGKFVAVDIATGSYEIDEDDFAAVTRLRARLPAADIWLTRAGQSAAYRLGRRR